MLYVMADIHGHEGRFDSILKQIDLQPEDTLYILGDVIDRSPAADSFCKFACRLNNAVFLRCERPVDHECNDGIKRVIRCFYLIFCQMSMKE